MRLFLNQFLDVTLVSSCEVEIKSICLCCIWGLVEFTHVDLDAIEFGIPWSATSLLSFSLTLSPRSGCIYSFIFLS